MNKKDKFDALITEMKLMLQDSPRSLTVEGFVFDKNNDPMKEVDNVPPHEDSSVQSEQTPNDDTPLKSVDNEKVAQNVSPVDGEIKPLIDQIRVLALKGVAKLANNPTSESYQLLKKIWQTVDKAAETAAKPQGKQQAV